MRQVFINLIVNAIHAIGASGDLRIECEWTEHEAAGGGGGEVVAHIIDDGCGISPELIDRVFDPFFTTKPAGKGTGLGLYICYEIIRMHHGSLRVRSDEGVGTHFEVHLPAVSGDASRARRQQIIDGA
jgi:signal transduction histidine kinase